MEPQYPLPHPLPAFVVLRKTVDEEQDVAYFMRFVFFRNSISVCADLSKSDCVS